MRLAEPRYSLSRRLAGGAWTGRSRARAHPGSHGSATTTIDRRTLLLGSAGLLVAGCSGSSDRTEVKPTTKGTKIVKPRTGTVVTEADTAALRDRLNQAMRSGDIFKMLDVIDPEGVHRDEFEKRWSRRLDNFDRLGFVDGQWYVGVPGGRTRNAAGGKVEYSGELVFAHTVEGCGVMRYSLADDEVRWATDTASIMESMTKDRKASYVTQHFDLVGGGKTVLVTLSNGIAVEFMTLRAEDGKITGRWNAPVTFRNGLQASPDVTPFDGGVALTHNFYSWDYAYRQSERTVPSEQRYDVGLFRLGKPKG